MENLTPTTVSDLIMEVTDTITPEDTVVIARRRMESQTSRSLLVVEADRPVGIVQWRGLAHHDGSEAIRSVMQTAFPVLRSDMSIEEVRGYLAELDVDIDHLPVIDESGMLIGEVPRGLITKMETTTSSATEHVVAGPEEDRNTPTVHLESGMKVVGVSGSKIGTVDEVDLNSEGNIAHFTVKYGMLGRHAKRLPADVIRSVDGDSVNLSLDQMEFKMLADVGEVVV